MPAWRLMRRACKALVAVLVTSAVCAVGYVIYVLQSGVKQRVFGFLIQNTDFHRLVGSFAAEVSLHWCGLRRRGRW